MRNTVTAHHQLFIGVTAALTWLFVGGCNLSVPPAGENIHDSGLQVPVMDKALPSQNSGAAANSSQAKVTSDNPLIVAPATGKAFSDSDHQMFCNVVAGANGKGGFLTHNSFLMSWYLIGPFKFKPGAIPDVKQAIHYEYIKNEKVPPREGLQWHYTAYMGNRIIGEVDLGRILGEPEPNSAVYALTLLYAPTDLERLTLYAGSDDFIKIWINGKLIHTYNMASRSGNLDQDRVKGVKLHKGYNLLVVKIVNINRKWRFFLRFADEDDAPMKFLQQTLSAEELEKQFRQAEKDLSR